MHSFLKNALPGTLPHSLWTHNVEPYGEETLGIKDVSTALDMVAHTSGYAYLMHLNSARAHPLYPCSVIELPDQRLSSLHLTFAFQKDSPLTEIFNFFLSQMQRSGVVKRIWNQYYDVVPTDCAADLDRQLDFSSLFGLFLIVILGAAIAILMLFVEECTHVAKAKKKMFSGALSENLDTNPSPSLVDTIISSPVKPKLTWDDLLEIIARQQRQLEEQSKFIKGSKTLVTINLQ